MSRSLLIGCGRSRAKQVSWKNAPEWAGALTTVDMDPNCGADLLWDLERRPLPFEDETFEEIGAFNCLEHWGRQGDWRGWFDEMAEYHRILKPGGEMFILVPVNEDAFADPGHTRFFQHNYFGFLSQVFYDRNKELKSTYTDYRWYWKKNFDVMYLDVYDGHHLAVILRRA